MMGTWLQAAIEGGMGKQRLILYRTNGIYFSMGSTKLMMEALTNNAVIMHNDTTNKGVCPGEAQALSRQLKTAAHVYFIPLGQLNLPLLLHLNMLQNHATLGEIRKYLQKELAEIYAEGETRALVNIILEHLGHPSPKAFLHPELKPGAAMVAQINEIVREIHTLRPIQYILGYTTFFELIIKINENALIPRPETEELVHHIIMENKRSPEKILDLCTGSGCIALALKKEFPNADVTGLDVSRPALDLARVNGEINELEIDWIYADVLHMNSSLFPDKFDIVVSNPPYVLESEKVQMDKNVLDFEPHSALFVEEENPLIFYKAISQLAPQILAPGGIVWFEINERFGIRVADLMIDAGFNNTIIHKDIHEKQRFIQAR